VLKALETAVKMRREEEINYRKILKKKTKKDGLENEIFVEVES